jgi:hypothetical protein
MEIIMAATGKTPQRRKHEDQPIPTGRKKK